MYEEQHVRTQEGEDRRGASLGISKIGQNHSRQQRWPHYCEGFRGRVQKTRPFDGLIFRQNIMAHRSFELRGKGGGGSYHLALFPESNSRNALAVLDAVVVRKKAGWE